MSAEEKKLHLIDELLKVEDDNILAAVEKILNHATMPHSNAFVPFKSNLTMEELDELEKNIEEGCEQINEDDWK